MKPEIPVIVDVRAIDVGYFSTKLTLGRKLIDGNQSCIATAIFPSLAPRLPTGMAPAAALHGKPDGTVATVDGVNYFVGRDAILFSSGREPREVLPDYSLTDKYLALALGALHYIFEDADAKSELVIRHLVLGLPLNTWEKHCDALSARIQREHVLADGLHPGAKRRVTVEKVSVIIQPQGALMSYGTSNTAIFKEGWVMVVDPGGGTLDWYVARGRHPNWERSGAYPKGMLACAYAVADKINREWRDNIEIIERIDRAIRDGAPSFKTAGVVHGLEEYASAIEAVLKESVEKMIAKVVSLDNLDCIVVAGGGARIFAAYLLKRYPELKNILCIHKTPVTANVEGFHIAGEIMSPAKSR